ncbi:hypothetical protein D9M69_440740 [compost metagenome]
MIFTSGANGKPAGSFTSVPAMYTRERHRPPPSTLTARTPSSGDTPSLVSFTNRLAPPSPAASKPSWMRAPAPRFLLASNAALVGYRPATTCSNPSTRPGTVPMPPPICANHSAIDGKGPDSVGIDDPTGSLATRRRISAPPSAFSAAAISRSLTSTGEVIRSPMHREQSNWPHRTRGQRLEIGLRPPSRHTRTGRWFVPASFG